MLCCTAKSNGSQSHRRTLLDELKTCCRTRNLQRGREIHGEAMQSGSDSCIYVAAALISMYSKCGSMSEARQVFDSIKHPDVVSWSALMLGYADNGEASIALELFQTMRSRGCSPDAFTFVAALKACSSLAADQNGSRQEECLKWGRDIHSRIRQSNMYVQNSLIELYAKCRSMTEARQVFDQMKHPDVVSWNTIILGYADNGEAVVALDLFSRMKSLGLSLNSFTFVAALKACTCLAMEQSGIGRAECLKLGRDIHSQISCSVDMYIQSALMNMYAKCGSMVEARQIFEGMRHRDVVSWTALILGYADNGEGFQALDLYAKLKCQGFMLDSFVFVAALKACASLALVGIRKRECLERGREIHSEITCEMDNYLQSTLIDMYGKCGSMSEARKVFESMKHPDVVSWNALILGYADNGEGVAALDLFARMKSQEYAPNLFTFLAVLKACGLLGAVECGRKVHAEMVIGAEPDVISVTCLVDFYVKCGDLLAAQEVFDLYSGTRDLSTWNALLTGYSRSADTKAVFELLEGLRNAGLKPDSVTFLCILSCCSHAGLVEEAAECFEAMATSYGVDPAVEHYNCVIDVLGRSNRLNDAIAMVYRMRCKPNAVTWVTVLGACRKWKNVGLGWLAFTALLALDASNPAAHLLMAHTFGSKGLWKQRDMVLAMRNELDSIDRFPLA